MIARAPGVVVAGLPGYLVAGQDHMTLGPAWVTAALLVALTVVLMFLALRSRLSVRRSLLGSAALALTTPVWTVSADGIWPHTVDRGRHRRHGLGVEHPALLAGRRLRRHRDHRTHAHGSVVAILGIALARERRDPWILLQVGLPSASILAVESVWSHWMYGSWNPMASYGGSAAVSLLDENLWDVTNYLGMWMAPDRGASSGPRSCCSCSLPSSGRGDPCRRGRGRWPSAVSSTR